MIKFIRVEYKDSFNFINIDNVTNVVFEKPTKLMIASNKTQYFLHEYNLPEGTKIDNLVNKFTEFLCSPNLTIFTILLSEFEGEEYELQE